MKSFLFAAAAILAAPAIAQDQSAMADQAPTTQSGGQVQTSTDPDGMRIVETPGGYEPAGSPLKGTPEPGSKVVFQPCLLYTSPSPRDRTRSRMPSSA